MLNKIVSCSRKLNAYNTGMFFRGAIAYHDHNHCLLNVMGVGINISKDDDNFQ